MMSNGADDGSPDVGKYAYWEECYANEVKNFQSNGDRGEIWSFVLYSPVLFVT